MTSLTNGGDAMPSTSIPFRTTSAQHAVPTTMKAVVWEGKPYHMVVKQVPTPTIQNSQDVLVRVTSAAICGTDLHTYHGLLGGNNIPYNMGHEAIGIIVQAGADVKTLHVGDRIVIPDGFPRPNGIEFYGLGSFENILPIGGCQGISD